MRMQFPPEIQRGWRSPTPLHEQGGHVEVDMRFNGPTPHGPESGPWVFEDNGVFDCFSWIWNWGKRRRRAEQMRSKAIVSKMCANMQLKINDAEQRRVVIDDVVQKHVSNKDREGAKQALIGKKRLTKQLAAYRAYKRDLDMLHDSLEQTEDQKAFVKEMKSANKVLKKQKMTKTLDSVEHMLDDMDDHREDMEEFHNTLTSRAVGGDDIDDELSALFGDDVGHIKVTLPGAALADMPRAPTAAIAAANAELRDLNVLVPM